MSQSCEKHAALPVVGHSPCAGCEIERLKAENVSLHAQVDTLAERHASALCEIEALRKTHESLRPIIKMTEIEREGAPSEFDRLRKDAERWRFIAYEWPKVKLRENAPWFNACFLEREIDAAMSKDPLANPGQ